MLVSVILCEMDTGPLESVQTISSRDFAKIRRSSMTFQATAVPKRLTAEL